MFISILQNVLEIEYSQIVLLITLSSSKYIAMFYVWTVLVFDEEHINVSTA